MGKEKKGELHGDILCDDDQVEGTEMERCASDTESSSKSDMVDNGEDLDETDVVSDSDLPGTMSSQGTSATQSKSKKKKQVGEEW